MDQIPSELEIKFEKESLYKLYQTGTASGINPERWERVRREIRFEDVVSELYGHTGESIRCPFHGSDSTPSFWLYKRTNDGWCFGCLHEDETVWSVSSGLKRIGDLQVGESVYDRYGNTEYVLHTEAKQGDLFSIETHNSKHPLLLTPDHTCFYVKRAEAINHLPFLVKSKDRLLFWGTYKRSHKLRKKAYQTPIREDRADSIHSGDYMLFPVIEHRQFDTLINPAVRPYVKGTVPNSVAFFPVNPIACRLYGLYLAEGSTNPTQHPRTTRWTLHLGEAATLGCFIQKSLMEVFGLTSTLTLYPEKTTCEVVCSSVELSRGLAHWFGSGAENKKLPGTALTWYAECQKALIQGYLEGDGEKSRERCANVSKSLGYGIWALGIQVEKLSNLRYKPAYVDKRGVSHRESWIVDFSKRESKKRFFHSIKGQKYYWSEVSNIGKTELSGVVVDIIVSGSESFLTKLGGVHNCPPKEQYYDHVRFVSKYLDVSRVRALNWLEKKWELPAMPNLPEEEEGEDIIQLGFADLQEPYIRKAIRHIQEFKDVELAEDYLRYYFEAVQQSKWAEDAKKQSEIEDAVAMEAKSAMTLAKVLGKEEIKRIFARKAGRSG